MFWADRIAEDILKKKAQEIEQGKTLVIRDEKTASGRVHVGSMRGVAIHGIVSRILTEKGVKNKALYEINDFDPMDGLPVYLDEEKFRPYMGKQLFAVPSPDLPAQAGGKAKNYAEYFGQEFTNVIEESGFHLEYYRGSDLYLSGKMNEVMKIALERADDIRKIYKEISGSNKEKGWLPISVLCENCGNIGTTRAYDFDGETVAYTCEPNMVEWAKGCGHSGRISPFDGKAKFSWKVDWAAKFKVVGVDIEGGGKDHSTKGGARDVANHISREVFEYEPPFDIPYEFFLVGGKKMSSSKGKGSSAREIADLLPPQIFRLALLGKDIKQAINFEPEGDTIPVLFDNYDRIAEKYWNGEGDDDARLFELIHTEETKELLAQRFLPRFREIVFITQMSHLNYIDEIQRMKGGELSPLDLKEADLRAEYAKKWIDTYAPEEFIFKLQTEAVPERAKNFSDKQKEALQEILRFIEENNELDGQALHTKLHEIRQEKGIEPKELFSPIYLAFLGKESGPKAGWFLSVIPRDFLLSRLKEVSI